MQHNPKSPTGYIYLAYICGEHNEFEKAEEYCTKAIEVAPDNAYAYQNRGNAKAQLGKSDPCEDWQRAASLGSDEAKLNIKENCK